MRRVTCTAGPCCRPVWLGRVLAGMIAVRGPSQARCARVRPMPDVWHQSSRPCLSLQFAAARLPSKSMYATAGMLLLCFGVCCRAPRMRSGKCIAPMLKGLRDRSTSVVLLVPVAMKLLLSLNAVLCLRYKLDTGLCVPAGLVSQGCAAFELLSTVSGLVWPGDR